MTRLTNIKRMMICFFRTGITLFANPQTIFISLCMKVMMRFKIFFQRVALYGIRGLYAYSHRLKKKFSFAFYSIKRLMFRF